MKPKLKDFVLLALLAALMSAGDFLFDFLPNIHLVGVLTVVTTVIYRCYALVSIYIYVLIQGIAGGFQLWWIPYLYIWDFLWLFVMIIPQKLPERVKNILYVVACAAHGYLFGTLYAPSQVFLFFGGDFSKMIPWIIAGIPADIIHGTSNLILGTFLIYPLTSILKRAERRFKG